MFKGCSDFNVANQTSRRDFIRIGSAGFAGLGLPGLLKAEGLSKIAPKAKHVIFLHQWGGPSHIDTFDMKPDGPSAMRGSFKPIASSLPGVNLCEHLPNFSKVLHKFAQIRSVNHKIKNHNPAGYYSLSGHAPAVDDIRLRDTLELYPSYGSTVSRFKPVDDPAVPTYVSYPWILRDGSVTPGQGASYLGKQHAPFFINRDPSRSDFKLPELSLPASTTLARLEDRRGLLKLIDEQDQRLHETSAARGIDAFHDRALAMLASPKVKKAFDLSQEPEKLREAYGRDSTYAQGCLLARRLVETGVRFVTVYYSPSIGGKDMNTAGWDTHGDNFNQLKDRLLPITDRAVPTLIHDLESRGLLDETLVLWMGEFGRSPKIGSNNPKFGPDGRDHWPQCYTVLMAGGGVRPGAIFGASDKIGGFPTLDPVKPDDVAATLYWALGIDPASEVTDTLGRPLPIAAGRPITDIFG